jgi:hypothetical protein
MHGGDGMACVPRQVAVWLLEFAPVIAGEFQFFSNSGNSKNCFYLMLSFLRVPGSMFRATRTVGFLFPSMHHHRHPQVKASEHAVSRRRPTVERIAMTHIASMGGTLDETIGEGNRQRLVWLGLLAMPLLLPIALPGMASAVGGLCLLVAFGICTGQPIALPRWLARRELGGRAQTLLARMVGRALPLIARVGRPRMLPLSDRPARFFNGLMLSVAGVSMAMPVPMISFDNVLPALAMVLIAWGLRLRDGLLLLAGYLATALAAASVFLLWWGGTVLATKLWSMV